MGHQAATSPDMMAWCAAHGSHTTNWTSSGPYRVKCCYNLRWSIDQWISSLYHITNFNESWIARANCHWLWHHYIQYCSSTMCGWPGGSRSGPSQAKARATVSAIHLREVDYTIIDRRWLASQCVLLTANPNYWTCQVSYGAQVSLIQEKEAWTIGFCFCTTV